MTSSFKQSAVSEPCKPGKHLSTTEYLKAKFPVIIMPMCIIAIVYFVDNVLFHLTNSENAASAEESTSGPSSNFFEIASIVVCVVLPAVYFNRKQEKTKIAMQVPNAEDAGARLRAKAPSKVTHASGESPSPKLKPLSQVLRTAEEEQKLAISKQAITLARYNQGISAAAKAGQPSKAVQILADIRKAGLLPDTISYNSVIHAFARQGDIRSAAQWLLKMKESSVVPNTISYNILMDTCVKANNSAEAEAWLERMQKDGVDPNEVSYATVIHARAKHGDSAGGEAWLRKMIEQGVEPNVVSYNSLIYACGKKGQAAAAEKWVEEMEERGVEARVTTYTAVIDACAKSGDVQRAEKWMEKRLHATSSQMW